jgi:hypothetical protein
MKLPSSSKRRIGPSVGMNTSPVEESTARPVTQPKVSGVGTCALPTENR